MATTKTEMLKLHEENAPAELIASMESFCDSMRELVDVKREPAKLFESEYVPIVTSLMMQGVEESIAGMGYDDNQTVCLEGVSEERPEETKTVSVAESHVYNMQTLMENSAAAFRTGNERNLNEITPFDGFLPFVIVRSYLPLVGKDLIPFVVPKNPFVRIKEKYKYIVTKDNQSYLRPDIYNDSDAAAEILAAAKGAVVTQAWFPAGTEVTGDSDPYDYEYEGKKYKVPTDGVRVAVDVLAESGGMIEIGDALDIDVHIAGARGVVTNSEGKPVVVEVDGLEAYPDITSYNPQRSFAAVVKYQVKNSSGKVESIVEDKIQGSYNHRTSTFEVMSFGGITKQIRFGGHMSNKNNTEYITYRNEYQTYDHPIPEGFNMNAPLTLEDEQLYRETASIGIIADAVNEMSEISTNLEDNEIIHKIDEERTRWLGVSGDAHPFEHFKQGPVVISREVDVAYTPNTQLKRNVYVQDTIQYALRSLIGDLRTTCGNEDPAIVAFCHPNIAHLFTGDNVDWKITNGQALIQGIRTDYSMGIYTANGDSIRLVCSKKFKEADGLRGLALPVNETNFLSWKHYKRGIIFSKDYRTSNMPNNPNIRALSQFYTHSYVPLQIHLGIKNYK